MSDTCMANTVRSKLSHFIGFLDKAIFLGIIGSAVYQKLNFIPQLTYAEVGIEHATFPTSAGGAMPYKQRRGFMGLWIVTQSQMAPVTLQ